MAEMDGNDSAVDREVWARSFVVGATGCRVVDESVRYADAYFRIGVPGAN